MLPVYPLLASAVSLSLALTRWVYLQAGIFNNASISDASISPLYFESRHSSSPPSISPLVPPSPSPPLLHLRQHTNETPHKSFEAAALEYTTAIRSLEDLLFHIKLHGDEDGDRGAAGDGGRGRLAPLFWSRAAAHIMVGRYRSAVKDCALALEAARDWEQVRASVKYLVVFVCVVYCTSFYSPFRYFFF